MTPPLSSFSGLHIYTPKTVKTPATVDELRDDLIRFNSEINNKKQKITFRGGGYSFDEQSLNDDVIIDLSGLNRIDDPNLSNNTITVGPGATWKDITKRTLYHGLVPYVLVTTGKATAGGTISANCYSRSSIKYGREGDHVDRFQLLTVAGDIFECSRNQNSDLFFAAIGGFGYFGAITEITYNLLSIGQKEQVETAISKCGSLNNIVDQIRKSKRELDEDGYESVYALVFTSNEGERGIICKSRYTDKPASKTLGTAIYSSSTMSSISEALLRSYSIDNFVLNELYDNIHKTHFVDEFADYTFFMERLGESFGLKTIQQTFFASDEKLAEFLDYSFDLIRKGIIHPSWFDIVPMPEDAFLLSANKGIGGYVVSIAFDVTLDVLSEATRTVFKENFERILGQLRRDVYPISLKAKVASTVEIALEKMVASIEKAFEKEVAKNRHQPTNNLVLGENMSSNSIEAFMSIFQENRDWFQRETEKRLQSPGMNRVLQSLGTSIDIKYDDVLSDHEILRSMNEIFRAKLNPLNLKCLEENVYAPPERLYKRNGRVHLVKNVYATSEQLYTMYGPQMDEFLELKEKLDPNGILRNSFFDRVFGEAERARSP